MDFSFFFFFFFFSFLDETKKNPMCTACGKTQHQRYVVTKQVTLQGLNCSKTQHQRYVVTKQVTLYGLFVITARHYFETRYTSKMLQAFFSETVALIKRKMRKYMHVAYCTCEIYFVGTHCFGGTESVQSVPPKQRVPTKCVSPYKSNNL